MDPTRLNRRIQAELLLLAAQRVLTDAQAQRLSERYPATPWNVLVLVRWFTVLGAVTAAAGVVVLLAEVAKALLLLEIGLGLACPGFVALGRFLSRRKALLRTGAAAELLGSMALHGLAVALAIDFSTGSDNWPALIGVCCVLMAACAYLLGNRLVLILACCDFFVWFGGSTGYVSGWGAYWLGMNYPARFVAAGLATLLFSFVHARWLTGRLQPFARVYLHVGLLIVNLALWFLAVFGYFEKDIDWDGQVWQRLVFSALWAVVSVASIVGGSRLGQRAVRGYGLTFLVINVYTFYFQFVVAHTGEWWWAHMLLVGGSLVASGVWLERRLRARRAIPVGPAAPTANADASLGDGI